MWWRFKLWRIKRRDLAFEKAWNEYKKDVVMPMGVDRIAFREKWNA